jgi:hypothetical protein
MAVPQTRSNSGIQNGATYEVLGARIGNVTRGKSKGVKYIIKVL